jgi:hypothetical protein
MAWARTRRDASGPLPGRKNDGQRTGNSRRLVGGGHVDSAPVDRFVYWAVVNVTCTRSYRYRDKGVHIYTSLVPFPIAGRENRAFPDDFPIVPIGRYARHQRRINFDHQSITAFESAASPHRGPGLCLSRWFPDAGQERRPSAHREIPVCPDSLGRTGQLSLLSKEHCITALAASRV